MTHSHDGRWRRQGGFTEPPGTTLGQKVGATRVNQTTSEGVVGHLRVEDRTSEALFKGERSEGRTTRNPTTAPRCEALWGGAIKKARVEL